MPKKYYLNAKTFMPTAKNSQNRYIRTSLVSEKIEDKEIVLNHQKGTIISLNPSASEILSTLKSPKTPIQIIKLLEARFVSVSKVDVLASLKLMEEAGLIQKCSKSK